MAKYNYREFKQRIKSKNISKIYYFYGEEEFQQEEALDMLEIATGGNTIEKCLLYGSSFDLNNFGLFAGSPSLFGGQRLIITKEANKIKSSVEQNLINYIRNNIEKILGDSYFVFINPSKISRIHLSELQKLAAEFGEVIEFYPPYKDELFLFIDNYLRDKGKKINKEDTGYLLELTGENLFDIRNELDKLILFIGDNPSVLQKDIDESSGKTAVENRFHLSDAIVSGNLRLSLKILENLIGEGEEINPILNQISYTFGKILICLTYFNNGYSENEITRKIGLPASVAKTFVSNSRKITHDQIYSRLKMIFDTEYSIKSGSNKNSDLRILITGLCN